METTEKSNKTKQIPYLRHRGEEITDSWDIINYIANVNKIDLDPGLTNQERAVSRSFMRMLDEGFSW